jgi:hypothetical protein
MPGLWNRHLSSVQITTCKRRKLNSRAKSGCGVNNIVTMLNVAVSGLTRHREMRRRKLLPPHAGLCAAFAGARARAWVLARPAARVITRHQSLQSYWHHIAFRRFSRVHEMSCQTNGGRRTSFWDSPSMSSPYEAIRINLGGPTQPAQTAANSSESTFAEPVKFLKGRNDP